MLGWGSWSMECLGSQLTADCDSCGLAGIPLVGWSYLPRLTARLREAFTGTVCSDDRWASRCHFAIGSSFLD
jgi:hypothetical protein